MHFLNLEQAAGINANRLRQVYETRARAAAQPLVDPAATVENRASLLVSADRLDEINAESRRDPSAVNAQIHKMLKNAARNTKNPVLRTSLNARARQVDDTAILAKVEQIIASRPKSRPGEGEMARTHVQNLLARLEPVGGPRNIEKLPIPLVKDVLDQVTTMRSRYNIFMGIEPEHTLIDATSWNAMHEILFRARAVYGKHIQSQLKPVVSKNAPDVRIEARSTDVRDISKFTEASIAFDLDATPENWANFSRAARDAQMSLIVIDGDPGHIGDIALRLDPSTRTFASNMQRIRAKTRALRESEAAARRLQDALILEEASSHNTASEITTGNRSSKKDVARGPKSPKPEMNTAEPLEAQENERLGEPLDAAIDDLLASRHAPTRFEGETARFVRDNLNAFADVIATNLKIRDTRRTRAELDVVLDNAIIECTMNTRGKDKQLQRQLHDRAVNPLALPVVLYAPNYLDDAVRTLPRAVHLARTEQDLADTLFSLRAGAMQSGRRNTLHG